MPGSSPGWVVVMFPRKGCIQAVAPSGTDLGAPESVLHVYLGMQGGVTRMLGAGRELGASFSFLCSVLYILQLTNPGSGSFQLPLALTFFQRSLEWALQPILWAVLSPTMTELGEGGSLWASIAFVQLPLDSVGDPFSSSQSPTSPSLRPRMFFLCFPLTATI